MKVTILQFPGTNCEYDTQHAFEAMGAATEILWHKSESLPSDTDLLVVAGGFSYGDYLRSGAIAKFSPVMKAVTKYANNGGKVLGICNGFQVLTEAGLLPGALKRNDGLHFISKHHHLKVENN
ncbi:MAG: phosphoribosylformylglycinamidine synthase I, partial [Bacteroidetes bacterium]